MTDFLVLVPFCTVITQTCDGEKEMYNFSKIKLIFLGNTLFLVLQTNSSMAQFVENPAQEHFTVALSE